MKTKQNLKLAWKDLTNRVQGSWKTPLTTDINNHHTLLTRQSDALTSPRFFHLLLFLFILGARHIYLQVLRGYVCLEMKSKWALHDWNSCSDSASVSAVTPDEETWCQNTSFWASRGQAEDFSAFSFVTYICLLLVCCLFSMFTSIWKNVCAALPLIAALCRHLCCTLKVQICQSLLITALVNEWKTN